MGREVAEARRGRWLLLGLCVLTSVSVGCDPPPLHPLRIGSNVFPGYEPLYVARDEGRIDPRSVRLVELMSTTQVLSALRAGALEAACVTLDETLQILERGADVSIVAVLDESRGADAVVARRELTGLAALRGRRVAVENSALGAWMLTRALESVGLTPKDVETVSVEVDDHLEAFEGGTIDAVVTFDPPRSRLIELGARVLFDSSQMPGEVVDVLVARRDALADPVRRAALKAVLRAWDEQVAAARADPLAMGARMRRLRSEPATVAANLALLKLYTLEDSRRVMTGPEPLLATMLARLARLATERNLLRGSVDLMGALDPSLLPEERR